jgi:phosphoglycolate phosphatase-like HAD superfamily hydrolase
MSCDIGTIRVVPKDVDGVMVEADAGILNSQLRRTVATLRREKIPVSLMICRVTGGGAELQVVSEAGDRAFGYCTKGIFEKAAEEAAAEAVRDWPPIQQTSWEA